MTVFQHASALRQQIDKVKLKIQENEIQLDNQSIHTFPKTFIQESQSLYHESKALMQNVAFIRANFSQINNLESALEEQLSWLEEQIEIMIHQDEGPYG